MHLAREFGERGVHQLERQRVAVLFCLSRLTLTTPKPRLALGKIIALAASDRCIRQTGQFQTAHGGLAHGEFCAELLTIQFAHFTLTNQFRYSHPSAVFGAPNHRSRGNGGSGQ